MGEGETTGACKPRALGPLEVLGWKLPHQQFADVVAVLKDRYCYCLGISRPIDQETAATKKNHLLLTDSQEEAGMPRHGGGLEIS